jgi:hypothetical protein
MAQTFEQFCRRKGGWRRYNANRIDRQNVRRYHVWNLYWELVGSRLSARPRTLSRMEHSLFWGIAAEIARQLGVSRSTICRDLATMPDQWEPGERGIQWPQMMRR